MPLGGLRLCRALLNAEPPVPERLQLPQGCRWAGPMGARHAPQASVGARHRPAPASLKPVARAGGKTGTMVSRAALRRHGWRPGGSWQPRGARSRTCSAPGGWSRGLRRWKSRPAPAMPPPGPGSWPPAGGSARLTSAPGCRSRLAPRCGRGPPLPLVPPPPTPPRAPPPCPAPPQPKKIEEIKKFLLTARRKDARSVKIKKSGDVTKFKVRSA